MKHIKFCVLLVLLACFWGFASCSKNEYQGLNKLVVKLAEIDGVIDKSDWKQLAEYIDANKVHFKDWYVEGRLDVEMVKSYIQDLFERRKSATDIKFIGVEDTEYLKVNFYLERSGSMTPYDSPNGDGSFKSAVVQLLNALPNGNDDNSLFIVNSTIEPYPKGIDRFLQDANIFEATKGIGDPRFTDFGAIFNQLINNTQDNELSILVTDLIYSTKTMTGVSPQKVFAEARGMIGSVFKGVVKDKLLLVIKMRGRFDGSYYSYNSPHEGKKYTGYRPYYIILVGSTETISRLSFDSDYSAFSKMSELNGFESQYLFANDNVYEPYYTILLNSKDNRGRFKPERGQTNRITHIEDAELDENSGELQFSVAVDLKGMFIDENYLLNIENYLIKAEGNFTIKSISTLDKSDLTQSEKKYASNATHVFVLSTDKIIAEQEVEIKLLNHLPQWVNASSSDDDTDVKNNLFPTTTFGLRYLLEGIYSSYKKNSSDNPYYFKLDLNIKK